MQCMWINNEPPPKGFVDEDHLLNLVNLLTQITRVVARGLTLVWPCCAPTIQLKDLTPRHFQKGVVNISNNLSNLLSYYY